MNRIAISATPELPPARSLRQIMAMVMLALAPGAMAGVVGFGFSALLQIFLALSFALLFEAVMLKLRAQPMIRFLTDFSAPVTAVLFALLIPPSAPWWVAAIGMGVAIVLAKHCFGGLGRNLFNPAMAGIAAVWLCAPQEFAAMLAPASVSDGNSTSPLHNFATNGFSGRSHEWLAIAYALGGIFLLRKKIIPWQTPFATLTAAALSNFFLMTYASGETSMPLSRAFPEVWILGAFFVVTDPVTGCISARGRLLFGAGVGILGCVIGQWSGPVVGLASAVLLMNCVAPWLDQHFRPGPPPTASAAPQDASP